MIRFLKYCFSLGILLLLSSDGYAGITMPDVPFNLASKICKIRAAFCGDTAIVIISVAFVTFGILVLTRKMDWTLAMFFIIGAIIFAGVEFFALALFYPTLFVSTPINPLATLSFAECVCANNFIARFLGFTNPTNPALIPIDCKDPANWGETECSQCNGLVGNSNACTDVNTWESDCCDCTTFIDTVPQACDYTEDWVGECCSCNQFPTSPVCAASSCTQDELEDCAENLDFADPCCTCNELQLGLTFCSNTLYHSQSYSDGLQFCQDFCGDYNGNCDPALDCSAPENAESPCCP